MVTAPVVVFAVVIPVVVFAVVVMVEVAHDIGESFALCKLEN